MHRIGQSGVASPEREQMTTKQRDSAKLNESAKSQGIVIRVIISRTDFHIHVYIRIIVKSAVLSVKLHIIKSLELGSNRADKT